MNHDVRTLIELCRRNTSSFCTNKHGRLDRLQVQPSMTFQNLDVRRALFANKIADVAL